ncbi:MAG TPA: hypothetical protein VNT22_02345 [Baekduia sp.]|nr:hypothetical protein [Baekduia sp.]
MSKATWYTALTGLVFVIIVIIGVLIAGNEVDATKDSAAKIIETYQDDRDTLLAGTVLEAIAAAMLVYYGLHLRVAMAASRVAPMILIGTAVIATGLAIDASLTFAVISATDDPDVAIDPSAIQAMQLIYNADFVPFILGAGLFGTAAGIATIQTGVFPKWLGWIAVVLGVVAFAGPVGFFGLIGLVLWIGATSVMLAINTKNASAQGTASADELPLHSPYEG